MFMLLLFISQVATASTYYLSDVGIRGPVERELLQALTISQLSGTTLRH